MLRFWVGGYTPFSAIPCSFVNEFACDKPHYPYELPKGWCWTTLGEVISIKSGNAIKVRNNKNGSFPIYGGNGISAYSDEYNIDKPTIVIGRVGFYCGSIHYVKSKAWVTDNTFITSMYENAYDIDFLYYLLIYCNLRQYSNSTAQPVISGKTIYPVHVPVPPIKEQRKIVEKIEFWLSCISQLEFSQSKVKSTIKQAKSKILDLAIHGKLVPQDPNDEPASELLKRINPKAEITCDNPQYGKLLPDGWCMTNIGSLFEAVSAKRVLKSEWKNKGIPFYRAREIVQLNKEGFTDKDLFISEEHYAELKEKYGVPICGDIMISAVGSIGYTYIVRKEDVFYYKDASVLCLKNTNHWNPTFFTIWLASPFLQEQMYKNSKGTTVDTITLEKLKGYALPFPPIKEQQRIVAKIEELFAQLDNIASSL